MLVQSHGVDVKDRCSSALAACWHQVLVQQIHQHMRRFQDEDGTPPFFLHCIPGQKTTEAIGKCCVIPRLQILYKPFGIGGVQAHGAFELFVAKEVIDYGVKNRFVVIDNRQIRSFTGGNASLGGRGELSR